MKSKKLIKKLQDFFDEDKKQKSKKVEEIQKVLKLLKQKELKTKQEILDCTGSEKLIKLQQKVDIIYAQRSKGVKAVQELQEQAAEL